MKVLAFDFGASSGRAILGNYENGKLTYEFATGEIFADSWVENWNFEENSYPLPNSVVNVNDCCNSTLTYFEIPSNVTKLGNNCFENCSHLSKIDGLERIRQFGKGCFAHCNQLNVKDYPFLKKKWKKLK